MKLIDMFGVVCILIVIISVILHVNDYYTKIDEYNNLVVRYNALADEYDELRKNIKKEKSCPNCGQPFLLALNSSYQ